MEHRNKVAVVERYFEAFHQQDMDIIRELFADNAVVEDPIGTDPRVGIDAVVAFFEGPLAAGPKLELVAPVRIAANSVAFAFQAKMGENILDIIDVFTFDDAGKIVDMKAYWDPETLQT